MLNLIIKDIAFNKLQVIFGLLVVAASSLIIIEGKQYMVGAFFVGPSLLFLKFVGKSCYLDDKNSAYIFLSSLPIPKKTIVLSKYVESILVLVVAYAVIFSSNLVLEPFGQPVYQLDTSLLMIVSMLLTYYAVFLALYFKYDFASAQQSAVVNLAAMFGVFKLQDYLNGSHTELSRIIQADFLYLLLILSIVIFWVSYKISRVVFEAKE